MSDALMTLSEIAAKIESGTKLALPVDYAGVSMAVMPHILAGTARDLDLVCVPTGGLQPDILIGAGKVRSVETSAMTLGEAGGAPCFRRAVSEGSTHIRDATCPAIHAGLMAAQKGVPFMAIRGLIGSDVLRHRVDWKVIQNPMSDKADEIVIVPPILPDVALFHAAVADSEGNVLIGRRRELASMAFAAKRTFITVERVIEGSLFETEESAAGTLPAIYVNGIALAPKGAWPYGLSGEYETDSDALLSYAKAARTQEGFDDWLNTYLSEGARS